MKTILALVVGGVIGWTIGNGMAAKAYNTFMPASLGEAIDGLSQPAAAPAPAPAPTTP